MTTLGLSALAAATVALASPAFAQSPPPAPAKARWSIDYGVQRCSLFRSSEGMGGTTFGLRIIPGRENPEILFVRDSFKPLGLDLAANADLVLLTSGERFQGRVAWTRLGDGQQVMMVDSVRGGFIDAFAAAKGLAVEARGKKGLELAFSGSTAAVKALRECNDALLRAWGVDYYILAGTRPPEPIGGGFADWFSDEDYPRASLIKNSSGTVIVRLDIAPDGSLAGCTVVATSGDRELDEQTCTIFRKRARYKPALDPSGKPIKMSIAQTIHWALRL